MRQLIVLTILAVAFSSCSNVGKYKEAIESLSSEWDSTSSQVTSTVEQLTKVQGQATAALQSMNPSEEITNKLSDEQKNQLNMLKQNVQGQIGGLGQLAQQAFEFVSKWQEEGSKLTALKDGLASGKLPGDVQATIDSLKGLISTAGENVAAWTDKANAAKEAVDGATQSYNDLIAGLAQ